MVCSSESYWCLPPPITGLVMDHDYSAKNHLLNLLFSQFFFKEVQLRIYDSGKKVFLYVYNAFAISPRAAFTRYGHPCNSE